MDELTDWVLNTLNPKFWHVSTFANQINPKWNTTKTFGFLFSHEKLIFIDPDCVPLKENCQSKTCAFGIPSIYKTC